MKAVIQRVTQAEVKIDTRVTGSIGAGMLILLGIEAKDSPVDIEWLSAKICNLRIFPDDEGVMNRSVKDVKGDILLVSQFTLHASTRKGNRPSYIKAARPEIAIPIYEEFIQQVEHDLGKKIQTGKFGAMMDINLINSGPVTIIIDSKNRE